MFKRPARLGGAGELAALCVVGEACENDLAGISSGDGEVNVNRGLNNNERVVRHH